MYVHTLYTKPGPDNGIVWRWHDMVHLWRVYEKLPGYQRATWRDCTTSFSRVSSLKFFLKFNFSTQHFETLYQQLNFVIVTSLAQKIKLRVPFLSNFWDPQSLAPFVNKFTQTSKPGKLCKDSCRSKFGNIVDNFFVQSTLSSTLQNKTHFNQLGRVQN